MIVQGIDFRNLPVGTRLKCNDVLLEMTQIGKECHHGCQIFQKWENVSCHEKGYLQKCFMVVK